VRTNVGECTWIQPSDAAIAAMYQEPTQLRAQYLGLHDEDTLRPPSLRRSSSGEVDVEAWLVDCRSRFLDPLASRGRLGAFVNGCQFPRKSGVENLTVVLTR